MAQLIIIGFTGRQRADEIMLEALKDNPDELKDLEDAVVVTRNREGRLRVKPYCDILAAATGHKSQLWGKILSALFECPDRDSLCRIGIDGTTCDRIESMLVPDSSAILVLSKQLDAIVLRKRLEVLGGNLLHVGLAHDDERQLVDAIRA